VALLAALLLVAAGCGEDPPKRGSAQDQAANASGRAAANAEAADSAHVAAASARAAADQLEKEALAHPSAEAIHKAADARVDAAAKEAVDRALQDTSRKATEEAERAAKLAATERAKDDEAADFRRWVYQCRLFGLAGVAAGVLLGGLLAWLVSPKLGAPLGAIIVTVGLMVIAFGQTVTWLPLVLALAIIAGLVVWALAHSRTLAVTTQLSKTVDTLEGNTAEAVGDVKDKLGAAVKRSWVGARLARAREGWLN
jgi:membrane protein implicated in regulation of membrane protease activity